MGQIDLDPWIVHTGEGDGKDVNRCHRWLFFVQCLCSWLATVVLLLFCEVL
jgi:hypothetical protein